MDEARDAFGRALLDWVGGETDPEIVERDDGFVDTGAGPEVYLAPFEEWPQVERRAMRFVRGRVLDVGCGAGRVALHLQSRGFEVTGIDHSPLAVKACRERGLKKVERLSIDRLAGRLPRIDTIVLFGNNFGIFGSPDRVRKLLVEWRGRAPSGARILAESMDPYRHTPGYHRAYQRMNRQRGCMPGTARLRVRYRTLATPWFDWLFVSQAEMRRLLGGTGWHVRRFLSERDGPLFVGIIEKDPAGR